MLKDRIRELRKGKKLTQKAFASSIGVAEATVGFYEQGRKLPGEKTISRICDIYGVDRNWLMDEKETEEKPEAMEPKESPSPAAKAAVEPSVIVESQMGGQISVEEVEKRVRKALRKKPKLRLAIYIKAVENKAYYSSDAGDGFIDLW